MVEVKRTNYPARTIKYRSGREKYLPEWHECRYLHNGREIATYNSNDDILYCKTDLIGHDFKRSVYDRATTCKLKDAFCYLFAMLGVDETSSISEYTNL